MPKDKKSHTRAPGMTQISISLPEEAVKKIDELAKEAKRSRSNFIAYVIANLPIPQDTENVPFLQAAEPKQLFNAP